MIWADAPERYEAGSPNVIGAVALAAACERLDMEQVEAQRARARRPPARRPGGDRRPHHLALWPGHHDRVGVATSPRRLATHRRLAQTLSDEFAIGVRHGCFCAHPLLTRLLGVSDAEARRLHAELKAGREPELPGAVRASIGLGTTAQDVDALLAALIACQTR